MACPRCESHRTVSGQLIGGNTQLQFNPNCGFRWTSLLSKRLYLDRTGATVCAECGLLWMEFPTASLTDKIRRWGTPEAKEWLDSNAPEPFPGKFGDQAS
jgi:hypothetical protein